MKNLLVYYPIILKNLTMNKLIVLCLTLTIVLSCKTPEARKPETVKSGTFFKESVERNKKLFEKEKQKIQTIIGQDSISNYLGSESGFWYKYIVKTEIDSLQTPNFGDIVNFNYNVSDLNGNKIYTKEELKTRNYAMDKEELFTGLREGLKLMKAGETVNFLFPSQKAYGYYGDENKIGTNIPIICEVTVNSITQK